LRWSFTASQGPSGVAFDPLCPVLAADGTLYVGSDSKELYAFGGPTPTPTSIKPTLTMLSRRSGHRGTKVTITGTGFGVSRGGSRVRFGKKECTTYLYWSDTRIKLKVPAKAVLGKVKVTVQTSGGSTNAKSFTVKR
jgi:hypothetical protein